MTRQCSMAGRRVEATMSCRGDGRPPCIVQETTKKKSRAQEVEGPRKLILGSMGLSGTMFSLAQLYLENCCCLLA
jgi:hypothetical protein